MNSEKCLNITQRHFHILSYKIKHVNVSLVNFEARLLRSSWGVTYVCNCKPLCNPTVCHNMMSTSHEMYTYVMFMQPATVVIGLLSTIQSSCLFLATFCSFCKNKWEKNNHRVKKDPSDVSKFLQGHCPKWRIYTVAELEGQIWFASKNTEWRSRRGKYSRILHISVVHGTAYITLWQGKTEWLVILYQPPVARGKCICTI